MTIPSVQHNLTEEQIRILSLPFEERMKIPWSRIPEDTKSVPPTFPEFVKTITGNVWTSASDSVSTVSKEIQEHIFLLFGIFAVFIIALVFLKCLKMLSMMLSCCNKKEKELTHPNPYLDKRHYRKAVWVSNGQTLNENEAPELSLQQTPLIIHAGHLMA